MTAATIGIAFSVVWFIFAVPTAVFLLRAYKRSKMSGFIWLLVALIIWPFLAQGVRVATPMLAAIGGYGINPMLMLNLGLTVIGGVLLLIAVVVLDRELGERIVPSRPSIPPMPPPSVEPVAPPPPTDSR